MSIPPAEAQLAARWLRDQANYMKSVLAQRRAEVTGRPDDLTSEADLHETQASDLQTAYNKASAQVLGLAQSWKGDHYESFAREGRTRLDKLSAVVRALRRERAYLLRCAVMLRRSARGFDSLIERLEAKAQLYIGQTPVQQYSVLSRQLLQDYNEAHHEGQKIIVALARVLDERFDFFPQQTSAARSAGYSGGGSDPLPQPRPQNPQGEFDEAVNLLLRRIRSDATSEAMQQLRLTWNPLTWNPLRVYNLFFSGGDLDTKPEFRTHFGMSARNDFTTPIPPEIGTIDGLPASMQFDLLGNIHYGYLNAAAGWPRMITDNGAIIADSFFNPRGVDWADDLAVQIGRELHARYPDPAQLRPEHIREALTRHFERFFEYGGFNPR